jgi:hypothetical protein
VDPDEVPFTQYVKSVKAITAKPAPNNAAARSG